MKKILKHTSQNLCKRVKGNDIVFNIQKFSNKKSSNSHGTNNLTNQEPKFILKYDQIQEKINKIFDLLDVEKNNKIFINKLGETLLKIPILYRNSISNFLKAYFIFHQDQYITRDIFTKTAIKAYIERQFDFHKIVEIKEPPKINNEKQVFTNSECQKKSLEIIKKKYAQSFTSNTIKNNQKKNRLTNLNLITPFSSFIQNKYQKANSPIIRNKRNNLNFSDKIKTIDSKYYSNRLESSPFNSIINEDSKFRHLEQKKYFKNEFLIPRISINIAESKKKIDSNLLNKKPQLNDLSSYRSSISNPIIQIPSRHRNKSCKNTFLSPTKTEKLIIKESLGRIREEDDPYNTKISIISNRLHADSLKEQRIKLANSCLEIENQKCILKTWLGIEYNQVNSKIEINQKSKKTSKEIKKIEKCYLSGEFDESSLSKNNDFSSSEVLPILLSDLN